MKKLRLAEVRGFSSIFILVGMLLVAVALPIATKLVQQNQENRSNAASSSCSVAKDVNNTKCSDGAMRKCKAVAAAGKTYYVWSKTKDCDHGCNSAGTACYTSTSTASEKKCSRDGKKYSPGKEICFDSAMRKCGKDGKWDKTKSCKNGCASSGGSCATESVCIYGSGEYSNGSIVCKSDGKLYKCSVSNKKGTWSVSNNCKKKGCDSGTNSCYECSKNSDCSDSKKCSHHECVTVVDGVIQDKDCTDGGGVCKKIVLGCESIGGEKASFLEGLCGSSLNDVKCCMTDSNWGQYKAALLVAVKQDSECASVGGVCESIKGGCNGSWASGTKCPSSDATRINCCIETDCNSSKCGCRTQEACYKIGCDWDVNGCHKETVTPMPYKSDNYYSACGSDSDCISGKCAMTDDTRTRVCIPITGIVYVCDRYNDDFYSETWVNGAQVGNGMKCSNGCNTSTGLCN